MRHAGDNRNRLTRWFARRWEDLGLPKSDATILIAASGGSDSAAALALLDDALPRLRLVACYVDHGLRPKASIAADIAAVRLQASATHATVIVRKISVRAARHSVEAAARAERYRCLTAVAHQRGASVVVTGHQADDVAEGVLLALVRGSGLDGMAALRAKRPLAPGIVLARPLLSVSRAGLRAYLRTRSLAFAEDETNADLRLRRNAVRLLLADLERLVPGAARNVARAAALLRGDRRLLDALAERALRWCRANEGTDQVVLIAKKLRTLPRPLARRVLRRGVTLACGGIRDFSMAQCHAIVAAVAQQRGGRFKAGSAEVEISAGTLRIAKAHADIQRAAQKPAKERLRPFRPAGEVTTLHGRLSFHARPPAAAHGITHVLDAQQLGSAALHVRRPRVGDKCVPSGRHHAVPLARFLAKAGVPQSLRGTMPLLCAQNRIVAVLGLRVMEPFSPKPGGKAVYLHWLPAEMPIISYTDRSEPRPR